MVMIRRGTVVTWRMAVAVALIQAGRQRHQLVISMKAVAVCQWRWFCAAVANELGVANGNLFALIPGQLNGASRFFGDDTLVATLMQQRINRLNLIPA